MTDVNAYLTKQQKKQTFVCAHPRNAENKKPSLEFQMKKKNYNCKNVYCYVFLSGLCAVCCTISNVSNWVWISKENKCDGLLMIRFGSDNILNDLTMKRSSIPKTRHADERSTQMNDAPNCIDFKLESRSFLCWQSAKFCTFDLIIMKHRDFINWLTMFFSRIVLRKYRLRGEFKLNCVLFFFWHAMIMVRFCDVFTCSNNWILFKCRKQREKRNLFMTSCVKLAQICLKWYRGCWLWNYSINVRLFIRMPWNHFVMCYFPCCKLKIVSKSERKSKRKS